MKHNPLDQILDLQRRVKRLRKLRRDPFLDRREVDHLVAGAEQHLREYMAAGWQPFDPDIGYRRVYSGATVSPGWRSADPQHGSSAGRPLFL